MDYDKNWAKVDVNTLPDMKVPAPGPKSKTLHDRAEKYMKGSIVMPPGEDLRKKTASQSTIL